MARILGLDELPHEPVASHGGTVLASWHTGFFGLEGTPESNTRWCGSSSGKLTLTNTARRPLAVTLHLQPQTGHKEMAELWIDGPLFSDRLRINALTPPRQATFVVPPGKHVLRISCDTQPTKDSYGMRTLTFHIRNFQMTEHDGAPVMPPAP